MDKSLFNNFNNFNKTILVKQFLISEFSDISVPFIQVVSCKYLL